MKNTVFSIVFFLSLSCFVKAQTPEVEWLAKNTRPEGDTYIEKLILLDNNGFIALRGKETMTAMAYIKLFLQRYDNDFKPGIVKFIPYRISTDMSPDNGKTPTIIYMGKFSEDVYLFTGNKEKGNNILSLMAKRIDPETLDIDENGIKLVEVSLPDKETRASYKNIHLATSSDGNNLMVLIDYPGSKDLQKKYFVYAFNNKLQLVWQKEVTLNYSNDNLILNTCSIDNNGNMAISAKLFDDKKSGARGKINYEFILFYLKSNNDNIIETKLSIAGISLARLEQTFDQKGNIVCGGFYTSPSMTVFKGVFIIQTESGKEGISNSSYKSFSPELLRTMLSDDVKDLDLVIPGSLDDYGYIIKDLAVLDNGTIKLIAEQKIEVACHSKHTFDIYNHRSFDNILCASADNTGKIQWLARIPKWQDEYPSNCYYFNSYHLKILNGTLQFLYNINPENLNTNKQLELSYGSKFVTVVTNIDENGKLTTNELWDPLTDKVMLVPKSCYFINDKQVIFEAKKGKNEYFVKLKF